MTRWTKRCLMGWLLCALVPVAAIAAEADARDDCDAEGRRVFSFAAATDCAPAVRGGTSSGPPVTFVSRPTPEWRALRAEGLDRFERDRRAILALAGDYRVDFEFVETIGYAPGYRRAAPYHSWATERVYVVADEGDFIQLQHIMVMFYETPAEDGQGRTVQGPVVMKHWRQDWRYEDDGMRVFRGDRHWQSVDLDAARSRGRWTQAVYQVDDAPRYEGIGRWQHDASRSVWESRPTWRPLPRRERSVRDDYDVLVGVNRITVGPTGWVHGQDNEKLVLDDAGRPVARIAREQGVDRYRRIRDFDFSAGDRYWRRTAAFWSEVRAFWRSAGGGGDVSIADRVDGTPHFAPLFDYAGRLAEGRAFDRAAARDFIERRLEPYVQADAER